MELPSEVSAMLGSPLAQAALQAVAERVLKSASEWVRTRCGGRSDPLKLVWLVAVDKLRSEGTIPDTQAGRLADNSALLTQGHFFDPAAFRSALQEIGFNEDIADALRRVVAASLRPVLDQASVRSPEAHRVATTLGFEGLRGQVAQVQASIQQLHGPVAGQTPPGPGPLESAHGREVDKARTLVIRGKYAKAKREYERIAGALGALGGQTDHTRFRVFCGLATCYANLHEFPDHLRQAEIYWGKALAICPNDADALANAAMVDLVLGEDTRCAEHAEQALETAPGHPQARSALAQALRRSESAEHALSRVYGWTKERGLPDGAINLEDATELATVALLLGDADRHEEALDCARRATELEPERADACQIRGGVSLAAATREHPQGRILDIIAAVDRPLLEDADEWLGNALASYEQCGDQIGVREAKRGLMQVAFLQQVSQRAFELAEDVLRDDHTDEAALQTLCAAALQLGRPDAALQALGALHELSAEHTVLKAQALVSRQDERDIQAAARLFRQVADDTGLPSQVRAEAGAQWALVQKGEDYASSVTYLDALAASIPEVAGELDLAAGVVALLNGDGDDAVRRLTPLKAMPGLRVPTLLNLASNSIRNLRDGEAALTELDEVERMQDQMAVQINRTQVTELRLMALHLLGRFQEYCHVYEAGEPSALAAQPLLRKGYMDALMQLDRYDQVIELFAAEPSPDSDILHSIGISQLQLGMVEQARQTLRLAACLPYDANTVGVFINLSAALALSGHAPQALAAASRALELAEGEELRGTCTANLLLLTIRFGEQQLLAHTAEAAAGEGGPDGLVRAFDVRTDMNELLQVVRESSTCAARVLRLYRSGLVPIAAIATMLRKPLIEVLGHSRDLPGIAIEAFVPTLEWRAQGREDIRSSRAVVPDYSALLVCARLELLGYLEGCFAEVCVPGALFGQLQADLLRIEDAELRRVWNFLRLSPRVRIVFPRPEVSVLEPTTREALGSDTADCIELAADTDALLLTLDARLQGLVRNESIARTAGPMELIEEVTDRYRPYPAFRHQMVCRLAVDGFPLVPFEHEDLVWAAHADGLSFGERSKSLFDITASENANAIYYGIRLLSLLQELWRLPDLADDAKLGWLREACSRLRTLESRVWSDTPQVRWAWCKIIRALCRCILEHGQYRPALLEGRQVIEEAFRGNLTFYRARAALRIG